MWHNLKQENLLKPPTITTSVKAAIKRSLLLVTVIIAGFTQAAEPDHFLEVDSQLKVADSDRMIPVENNGNTVHFQDQASAEKFTADAERHASVYNRQCTNTLISGRRTVSTDRTRLEFFHDQLYLFFSGRSKDCLLEGGPNNYKADADFVKGEVKLQ